MVIINLKIRDPPVADRIRHKSTLSYVDNAVVIRTDRRKSIKIMALSIAETLRVSVPIALRVDSTLRAFNFSVPIAPRVDSTRQRYPIPITWTLELTYPTDDHYNERCSASGHGNGQLERSSVPLSFTSSSPICLAKKVETARKLDGGLSAWLHCFAAFLLFFNGWGFMNSFGTISLSNDLWWCNG